MTQAILNSPKNVAVFTNRIICGDALKVLRRIPDESIDCVVTSPPYWALRDYGAAGQIGLESTIDEYLEKLLAVFDQIRRVLKSAGSCWVNFGDTYANKVKGGHQNKPQHNIYDSLTKRAVFPKLKTALKIPPKSLCLIPARFAVRMIEQGWILRNEIIWHKPNAMPQSVKDRFTIDYEKVFFFVKNRKYFFRQQFEPLTDPKRTSRPVFKPDRQYKYDLLPWSAVKKESLEKSRAGMLKKGRNARCVWTIGTTNFSGNHYAAYPAKLIETPIKAGCPVGGIVLDPFMGSGTTALAAKKLGRNYAGIELNPQYVKLARRRIKINN